MKSYFSIVRLENVSSLMAAMLLMFVSQVTQAMTYVAEISENELQAKIDSMMPMKTATPFISVILSNPDVDLTIGHNQIGLYTDVEIMLPVVIAVWVK